MHQSCCRTIIKGRHSVGVTLYIRLADVILSLKAIKFKTKFKCLEHRSLREMEPALWKARKIYFFMFNQMMIKRDF